MIGHKIAALSFKQFDHNLHTVPAQLYQIFWVKGFTTAPASIFDCGRVRSRLLIRGILSAPGFR